MTGTTGRTKGGTKGGTKGWTKPGSAAGPGGPDFASGSLPEHVVRGVVGFGALVGSVALIPAVGPAALTLLPVGLLALRGCPTCWTIGLMQTISRGRLQRSCEDGQCRLTVAGHRRAPGGRVRKYVGAVAPSGDDAGQVTPDG
ncbi:hypothetical protein [Kitasatospora sp. NPDC096204]|uniref:hypothetical protein n=1 Tax=Kitasatospora sp. NPDC096204 TaxID=3364094 RepID=UPI003804D82D